MFSSRGSVSIGIELGLLAELDLTHFEREREREKAEKVEQYNL